MADKPVKYNSDQAFQIESLEIEILKLEGELSDLESSLNTFEAKIRTALYVQISRINELTNLYKTYKAAKKAKRLEQKKRGKNYREPVGLKRINPKESVRDYLNENDQQEIKRLYKEAIVHVHPDKLLHADETESRRATDLTSELNDLYKRGDLSELSNLHEHIISGNALKHQPFQPESIVNPQSLLIFLTKKKEELIQNIDELKQSALLKALRENEDHTAFINELRLQFNQRIKQLELRTRKAG